MPRPLEIRDPPRSTPESPSEKPRSRSVCEATSVSKLEPSTTPALMVTGSVPAEKTTPSPSGAIVTVTFPSVCSETRVIRSWIVDARPISALFGTSPPVIVPPEPVPRIRRSDAVSSPLGPAPTTCGSDPPPRESTSSKRSPLAAIRSSTCPAPNSSESAPFTRESSSPTVVTASSSTSSFSSRRTPRSMSTSTPVELITVKSGLDESSLMVIPSPPLRSSRRESVVIGLSTRPRSMFHEPPAVSRTKSVRLSRMKTPLPSLSEERSDVEASVLISSPSSTLPVPIPRIPRSVAVVLPPSLEISSAPMPPDSSTIFMRSVSNEATTWTPASSLIASTTSWSVVASDRSITDSLPAWSLIRIAPRSMPVPPLRSASETSPTRRPLPHSKDN